MVFLKPLVVESFREGRTNGWHKDDLGEGFASLRGAYGLPQSSASVASLASDRKRNADTYCRQETHPAGSAYRYQQASRHLQDTHTQSHSSTIPFRDSQPTDFGFLIEKPSKKDYVRQGVITLAGDLLGIVKTQRNSDLQEGDNFNRLFYCLQTKSKMCRNIAETICKPLKLPKLSTAAKSVMIGLQSFCQTCLSNPPHAIYEEDSNCQDLNRALNGRATREIICWAAYWNGHTAVGVTAELSIS